MQILSINPPPPPTTGAHLERSAVADVRRLRPDVRPAGAAAARHHSHEAAGHRRGGRRSRPPAAGQAAARGGQLLGSKQMVDIVYCCTGFVHVKASKIVVL